MTRRCQWIVVLLLLLLLIAAAAPAAEPEATAEEKPASRQWDGQQVSLDEGPLLTQSFLEDLSVYKPIYFLFGVDPGLEQSKFQLSFKYRLFNPEGWMAAKAAWLSGFHLGYTQRSIWDLKSTSKPFDDTSYMPELFYLLPKIELNNARISAFGIQGGFQHESNGKGGEDSRSTNYLYIMPIMGIHLAGNYHLKIAPKIYTYIDNDDETNEDLNDYRGYVDLEVAIADPEGVALKSHLWCADEGSSVQLDLTYPMTRLFKKNLNFYLHAQYFSGYGETLLHYDRRQDVFRLGFSIVR
ncbi:phospholipase A [uncultured Desulfosarcina sp.]|uniref:phospholipase A n=1 Tax=uncultured Desulfosarcina sp. TaxID=218289 RepID=UPI0029C8472F|nr:phospholipase A [uncultured Desulfosarcina sp.]